MKNLLLIISLLSTLQTFAQIDLIPYRKGDKWGYANRQKEIMIEPQFEEAGEFRRYGITWVKVGEKYGYINTEGKFLTAVEFDKAGYFYFPTAYVTKDDSTFCIDSYGNRHICINGCGTTGGRSSYFRVYKKNGKFGLLNIYEKQITKDSFLYVVDSTAAIWDKFFENGQGVAAVLKDGKWGIIHYKYGFLVSYFYDEIIEIDSYKTGYFFITKSNNLHGLINYKGKIIAQPIYKRIEFAHKDIIKVWLTDDFWFYMDTKGTEYYERE